MWFRSTEVITFCFISGDIICWDWCTQGERGECGTPGIKGDTV